MLNRCEFIGNLGRDPEVRTVASGDKVANLSIGVSEKWKSKDGEKKERTEWVRVVIWGPLADVAEKYLKKGSKVYVSGSMETRKWSDQSGVEKYTTEIVMRGFESKLVMLDGAPSADRPSAHTTRPPAGGLHDSDIPF